MAGVLHIVLVVKGHEIPKDTSWWGLAAPQNAKWKETWDPADSGFWNPAVIEGYRRSRRPCLQKLVRDEGTKTVPVSYLFTPPAYLVQLVPIWSPRYQILPTEFEKKHVCVCASLYCIAILSLTLCPMLPFFFFLVLVRVTVAKANCSLGILLCD